MNQTNHKSNEEVKMLHLQQMIADYEAQLREARQTSVGQNPDTILAIQSILLEIEKLRSGMTINNPQPVVKPNNNYGFYALAAAGVAIAGALYFGGKGNLQPIQTEAPMVQTVTQPVVTTIPEPIVQKLQPKLKHKVQVQTAPEVQQPVEAIPITANPTESVAQYTVGSSQRVCGVVAQYKEFSKGVYLSMGHAYPNQDMTIVVWGATSNDVFTLIHKSICASGAISEYKGKPQVTLESIAAIEVQ